MNSMNSSHFCLVFTAYGMEKNPLEDTFDVMPLLQSQKQIQPFEDDKIEKLRELIKRLKLEADHKGHIIRTYFKDFDKHNHGVVTTNQFLQCVPFRDLKKEELQLILERYTNSSGFVNYEQFHEEIEGKADIEQCKSNNHGYYLASYDNAPFVEPEEVENLIRVMLMKYRLKIDECFRDYDPLRSGFITANQFKSALSSIKLPKTNLSEQQLESLVQKYIGPYDETEEKVKYLEFLSNVNKVFTETGLEKTPMKTLSTHKHLLKTSKQSVSADKEESIKQIITNIKRIVSTNRIYLKPFFHDFDRVTKGTYSSHHVSKTRFERALYLLGIRLSQREYDLLSEKYDDLQNEEVNYIMFMEDIEQDLKEGTFMGHPWFTDKDNIKFIETNSELNLEQVLERIVFRLYIDRIRVHEFLQDFDPLRSGIISNSQFRIGLNIGKVPVSDEEFRLIVEAYGDGESIKWKKFCDDMDKIFTEKNIEKRPLYEHVDRNLFIQKIKEKRTPKVDCSSKYVQDLLHKIRVYTSTRRMMLKPSFQDFDTHRHGRISKSQFSQCLGKVIVLILKSNSFLVRFLISMRRSFNNLLIIIMKSTLTPVII